MNRKVPAMSLLLNEFNRKVRAALLAESAPDALFGMFPESLVVGCAAESFFRAEGDADAAAFAPGGIDGYFLFLSVRSRFHLSSDERDAFRCSRAVYGTDSATHDALTISYRTCSAKNTAVILSGMTAVRENAAAR
jgi:hypothetical protein